MHVKAILVLTLLLAAVVASQGSALPTSCADPCVVEAATPGYLPPVASVPSGTEVVFSSIDVTHPTGEGFTTGETCFIVSTFAGHPSDPVRFDLTDGTLYATVNGVSRVCESAQTLPTGEGVIVFRCFLHSNMVGTLQVT